MKNVVMDHYNKNNPFIALIDLLERLIYIANSEMFIGINTRQEDFIISMPNFLISRIPEGMHLKYMAGFKPAEKGLLFLFKGFQIHPSSDLAITLYHKDYPLYKEEWMIHKIALEPIRKIKGEWYEEYILKLIEAPYFTNNKQTPENN